MSRSSKNTTRAGAKGRSSRDEIPERYQHALAIGVIFASLLIFFSSVVFKGETYLPPDTIAAHSWDTLLQDADAAGEFPLWNPYIFCGMPGYASLTFHGPRTYDLVSTVWTSVREVLSLAFLHQDLGRWIFYYLVLGVGMYVYVFGHVRNVLLSLLAAMGALFATYTIILVPSGHMTKIAVLAWFPWALMMLQHVKERFRWTHAVLLAVILHLLIEPGHVQFAFYIYLTFGVYLLYGLVRAALKREAWMPVIRTGSVLVAATLVALAMGADQYLSVLEYNSSSIRGTGPLLEQPGSGTAASGGGLDYDYATNWSIPPGELMTFVIPSWHGFGTYSYEGRLTQGAAQRINTYFGPQPFTEAPYYSGVIILFLAGIGFWSHRKQPLVMFMGIMIGISVLISFGKELPVLYDPMFSYFPLFNKFRIPSMILVLVQFFLPVLAAFGGKALLIDRSLTTTDEQKRRWAMAAAISGVVAGIMLVARGIPEAVYEFFVSPSAASGVFSAKGYHPQVAAELQNIVAGIVASDFVLAAAGVFLVCLVVVLTVRGSMSVRTAGLVLVVAVTADLWRVSSKPIESREQTVREAFVAPSYLPVLRSDSTLYRVLRLDNGVPPFDNSLAYWRVSSAYGYHGAKIRRYQDIVDYAGIVNPSVWRLMNVKYLILNEPDSGRGLTPVHQSQDGFVYRYDEFLPRAFFASGYEVAEDKTVMRSIADASYDPRGTVYLPEPLTTDIEPPGPGAGVADMRQGINTFSATVTATGNNLLILSDAYYPHGWRAYLNDTEVSIHRVNYFFRAIVVPPGTQTLRMEFDPDSYELGKTISLGMNILVLLALIGAGVRTYGLHRRGGSASSVAGNGDEDTNPADSGTASS